MLGGSMGAMSEEAPVMPSENPTGYPLRTIAGTWMRPIAAASEIAAPLIHEKPKLVRMLT
jgi:hypothetical protein